MPASTTSGDARGHARTIVVESPSSRGETIEVLRALVLVGVLASLVVAIQVIAAARRRAARR